MLPMHCKMRSWLDNDTGSKPDYFPTMARVEMPGLILMEPVRVLILRALRINMTIRWTKTCNDKKGVR